MDKEVPENANVVEKFWKLSTINEPKKPCKGFITGYVHAQPTAQQSTTSHLFMPQTSSSHLFTSFFFLKRWKLTSSYVSHEYKKNLNVQSLV